MGSQRARMWLGGLLALCGSVQLALATWGGAAYFFVIGPLLIVCGALQTVLIRRQLRSLDRAPAAETRGGAD